MVAARVTGTRCLASSAMTAKTTSPMDPHAFARLPSPSDHALARAPLRAYYAQACAKEMAVGFDPSAPRRPVNLSLNSDLVERCRSEVGNLSAHVEELLAADLEKRAAAAEAEKRRTERAIDAFSSLYEAHGSLSEEMQSL